MTDTITLPRSVVEQALEFAEYHSKFWIGKGTHPMNFVSPLRAALEQPQPLPSPVWRLVPTTMTNDMAKVDQDMRHAVPWIRWKSILAAAPQPPAVEQTKKPTNHANGSQASCELPLVSDQTEHFFVQLDASSVAQPPVVEQEPVAWQCRMRADWGRDGEWWPWQECSREKAEDYKRVPYLNNWFYESRPLYTHPQPRQPLTDEQIEAALKVWFETEKPFEERMRAAFAAAHNIGGEA